MGDDKYKKDKIMDNPSSHIVVHNTERAILLSRYLLLPMYVGLSFAMLPYCYVFFKEMVHMVRELIEPSSTIPLEMTLQLSTLSLLDMTMVANLIIMVTVGGYSIFIQELADVPNAPKFLKTLTSGALKVKMSGSIVGISAVRLIVSFININQINWETLEKQLAIHLAFLIGVLVFTFMESKLHPHSAGNH